MKFKHHYFISHSTSDKAVANELVSELELRGKNCWIDDLIGPGTHIGVATETALTDSKRLIVLLSPRSTNSQWVIAEYWTSQFTDPTNRNRKIIPIIVEECEIPLLLRALKHIDLTMNELPDAVDMILAS